MRQRTQVQALLPETDLSICRLVPDDAPELLAFYRSLSPPVARLFLPTDYVSPDAIREHFDMVRSGLCISLGLFGPGRRILGHAFVQGIGSSRPMLGIGLHDSVIGQGHGRRLMQLLLHETDRLKVPVVSLNVVKTNARAERLYRSMGFVITGQATFRRRNDSWSMERSRPDKHPSP